MKRRVVKADEWDVITGWRRVMTAFNRAGKTDRIKRRMRRRDRRDARRELHSLED